MKKYILTLVLAVLLVPSFSYAKTVSSATCSPQYTSFLEQLVTRLEQRLEALLTQQGSQKQTTQATTTQSVTQPSIIFPVIQNHSLVTTTPITNTTGSTGIQNPTFTVFKVVYEPPERGIDSNGLDDIYYRGNESIDPTSVQLTDSNGNVLQTTFTVTDSKDMAAGACLSYIDPDSPAVPKQYCGGEMMRLKPSVELLNGSYTIKFNSVNGDPYTGIITVSN